MYCKIVRPTAMVSIVNWLINLVYLKVTLTSFIVSKPLVRPFASLLWSNATKLDFILQRVV